jgi:hypothetical protein
MVKFAANSVEELMSELEQSLRGEKDWHDKVVENYETSVRKEHEEKQKRAKFLAEANRPNTPDYDSSLGVRRVFSFQEAEEALRNRRRLNDANVNVTNFEDESFKSKVINTSPPVDKSSINSPNMEDEIETPDIRNK